jgi:predicted lipase
VRPGTNAAAPAGLAVVAAFDIAVSLQLSPAQIAITTFGAPKVGTFAFVRRVARVVPSAH